MAKLDSKLIEHLAWLARIELTKGQLKQFGEQLEEIIGYVAKVGELPKGSEKPSSVINGLQDQVAVDSRKECLTNEQALQNAPSSDKGYFKVKTILE